jgi:hypothetical protein
MFGREKILKQIFYRKFFGIFTGNLFPDSVSAVHGSTDSDPDRDVAQNVRKRSLFIVYTQLSSNALYTRLSDLVGENSGIWN